MFLTTTQVIRNTVEVKPSTDQGGALTLGQLLDNHMAGVAKEGHEVQSLHIELTDKDWDAYREAAKDGLLQEWANGPFRATY